MAFLKANFSPVGATAARGKAPSIWSYRTADTLATVNTAGYFDNGATLNTGMRNVLSIGDIIFVSEVDDVDTPGSVVSSSLVNVVSNASGVIDVSDGTPITITDSD